MRTAKMVTAVAAVAMMVGMCARADAAPWRGRGDRVRIGLQVHIPVPHIYIPPPPMPVVVQGGYGYQPQQYEPVYENRGYNNGYYNGNAGYSRSCDNNRYSRNDGYRHERSHGYNGNYGRRSCR